VKLSHRLPVAILALSFLALPGSAAANHSWGGYHWARTANPFGLKVGDNLTGGWGSYLTTARSDWSQAPTGTTWPDVLDLVGVAGTSNKRCAAVAGTVQVCNNKYGNNGWLGLASIWLSGGHISQGTTKMNDTYFSTAKYNNANEKLHVVCQEVGHTFGLDHQSETGASLNTCMDYFSNTGANAGSTLSTHPNDHDYQELSTIYSHLDSSNTFAQSTATSPGLAGRSDAHPYRTTRHDHGNHTEVVEDFADGTSRVTDVIWADGPRAVVAQD